MNYQKILRRNCAVIVALLFISIFFSCSAIEDAAIEAGIIEKANEQTIDFGDDIVSITKLSILPLPIFEPPAGVYTTEQLVTITSAQGGTIRYATDGNRPDCDWGEKYVEPIAVDMSMSVLAVVCKNELTASNIAQADYTIKRFTISGKVTDLNGAALSGVSISVHESSAVTSTAKDGSYSLESSYDKYAVLTASLPGYSTVIKRYDSLSGSAILDFTLMKYQVVATVSAIDGGIVSANDGASVDLPPNSILDENNEVYTGDVQVSMSNFDVSGNELSAVPGDFVADQSDGSAAELSSFGVIDINLTNPVTGQALQLDPSAKAQIIMPFSGGQDVDLLAPKIIDFWFFDTSIGRWVLAGSATKSGSVYQASVSHFSFYNLDYLPETVCTKGRVLDNGKGVGNIEVRMSGQSGYYTKKSVFTDAAGNWTMEVNKNILNEVEKFAVFEIVDNSVASKFTNNSTCSWSLANQIKARDASMCFQMGTYNRNTSGGGSDEIVHSYKGRFWMGCTLGTSGPACECGQPQQYTWEEALATCQNLSYGGRDDWRLPEVNEIKAIVSCDDKTRLPKYSATAYFSEMDNYKATAYQGCKTVTKSPSVDSSLFPITISDTEQFYPYWSATRSPVEFETGEKNDYGREVKDIDEARYFVDFHDGTTKISFKSNKRAFDGRVIGSAYVRCVASDVSE